MEARKKIKNSENGFTKSDHADLDEEILLLESAKIASSKAMRSSMALGLIVKIIKGDKIIAIGPNQTTKIIGRIKKSKLDNPSLKKGMVLVRK